MLPLKADVRTRSFPLVTVTLIAVNVLVYLYELSLAGQVVASPALAARGARAYHAFIVEFGLIPCRVGDACPATLSTVLAGAPHPWVTVFTSMFIHGGFLHVGGNMLYLWIFGKSVEDVMGRSRFVSFYLSCGVAAAAAHYVSVPASPVPMVGASGAVSGALGAYLLLFPHARIWTLVGLGYFWRVIPVPAVIWIGVWILLQAAYTIIPFRGDEAGGVAWLAHVGGVVAGMVLVNVFRHRPRVAYRRY